MFDTRKRLLFFACLKDSAGAALENASPAPTNKKIGSGSGAALKVAAPGGYGSATLVIILKKLYLFSKEAHKFIDNTSGTGFKRTNEGRRKFICYLYLYFNISGQRGKPPSI